MNFRKKRNPAVVEMEIQALKRLIERRNGWLMNPENRMRSTYEAVRQDTQSIELQVIELEKELNELLQNTNF
ncbi:hypothetical protein AB6811_13370 [Tenuifilum sp. 4138str]